MEDMSVLGEAVAAMMDSLEDTEAELGIVAICVELKDEDDKTWTRIYCNDGRTWLQQAFLEQALDALVYENKDES